MRSSALVLRALQRLSSGGASEALRSAPAFACTASTSAQGWTGSANGVWQAGSSAGQAARGISSSRAPANAAPLAATAVEGDLAGVLREIDAAMSAEGASPKDVADAAMGLALLQARGDRRLWGKIFEKAGALKGSFDAASLTAFLWAAGAANVGHFKTAFDLAGPAAKLLGSFTPDQLATVVEALGKAGVNDPDVFKGVSDRLAKGGDFTAAQLAKLLWGAAAAGAADAGVAKAAAAAFVGKIGDATAKDAAQAAWALAKLGRVDKPALDAIGKALSTKLGGGEAPADAAAAVWAFATLNYKLDGQALSKAAAAIKAGAGELSAEQAIHAAWGLALLGSADKDVFSALLSSAGSAVSAAPDAVPVRAAAALCEAQTLILDRLGAQGPKLPDQVYAYAQGMYTLVADSAKTRRPAAAAAFHAAVATAAARAGGARYKPEVAAAVAALPRKTSDGLPVEMGLDLDKDLKVAILALGAADVSSTSPATLLGPAEAAKRLLEARGYKVASVLQPAFEAAKDDKARAAVVMAAIKAAAPGNSKVSQLEKQLAAPFDPYAE
ncbi:MAG: mitochondrial F1F0 ATP synthase associated protein [Monoraphidium minutum]|nr:MAG: mitochondrial F1F0 ATP synthase associated protein [Monoraphidium minutum]